MGGDAAAPASASPVSARAFWLAAGYVAAVLTVDALAASRTAWPIDWHTWFYWEPLRLYTWLQARGYEAGWLTHPLVRPFWVFKFVFWFLIPLAICLPRMDWGWFGVRRWKRADVVLLVLGLAAGLAALLLIPLIPGLREYYPDLSHLDDGRKQAYFFAQLSRTASWLLGWEFMHRYWLARVSTGLHPRYGWLVIPLFEMAYHLQKHWLEMLGMGAFSLIATAWAIRRQNMLLPFLVHLAIELGLAAFMLFA